jgi:hypothetical protein
LDTMQKRLETRWPNFPLHVHHFLRHPPIAHITCFLREKNPTPNQRWHPTCNYTICRWYPNLSQSLSTSRDGAKNKI